MSVDTKHPMYPEFAEGWQQMDDTYRGQRIVKQAGTKYLPFTSGMEEDGAKTSAVSDGRKAYDAYRRRAVVPDSVKEGVESMIGIMHNKPPVIDLPAALEPLRERATLRGESLEMLLQRINEEQLKKGRVGLLLDVLADLTGPALPYIALYEGPDMINWDDSARDESGADALNLVVIDETEEERTDVFEWDTVEKYRVLVLGDPVENVSGGGTYRVGVFKKGENFSEESMVVPSIAGKTLGTIPFVFVNTKDIVATPDEPPLIGLSDLVLTIYRGEADYRQGLFMQGQDTLVVVGGDQDADDVRVGAGATIHLPIGGTAEFIGVDSQGLLEMREALKADYARAKEKASSLAESEGSNAESGEALRIRGASRNASLNQIAIAGAFALQELLRKAAVWVGANPSEVIVTPNKDFVSDTMEGRTLVDYVTAKMLGAPLSHQSLHAVMQDRGLTVKTWEEELEQIAKETEEGMAGPTFEGEETGSTDPNGPEKEEGKEKETEEGEGGADE